MEIFCAFFAVSLSAMILFMYFMHFMCLYVIYIVIIVIIIIYIFGIMHLFFVSHGRFFGPPEHRFPKFGCTWGRLGRWVPQLGWGPTG